jgi:hypothetical protein
MGVIRRNFASSARGAEGRPARSVCANRQHRVDGGFGTG